MVIDSFSEIIEKSLNKKYLLYVLLIFLLAFGAGIAFLMALGLLTLLFLIPAIIIYLILQLNPVAIFLYVLLGLIYLLILIVASAVVDAFFLGLWVNLAKDFLEKSVISLQTAFDKTKSRLFDAVKLRLLTQIILIVIFLIAVAIPVILILLTAGTAALTDISELAGILSGGLFVIALILLEIILLLIIYLLIVPFLVVLYQIPFFEEKGAIASIKRAFELGKRNYLRNYAFVFLVFVLSIAVISITQSVNFGVKFIEAIGGAVPDIGAAIVIFSILLGMAMYVITMAVSIWLNGLEALFLAKVYLIDTVKEKAVNKK